jgi:hypothetical protein
MKVLKKTFTSSAVVFAFAWTTLAFAASGGKVSGMSGKSSGRSSATSRPGRMGANPKLRSFTSRAELKGNKTIPTNTGGGAAAAASSGGSSGGTTQSAPAANFGFGRPLKAKRQSQLKALPPH